MSKTKPEEGKPRGYRREGEPGGQAEAFWDAKRGAYGHLTWLGEFVAYECPAGFAWGQDGSLVPLAPVEAEGEVKIDG